MGHILTLALVFTVTGLVPYVYYWIDEAGRSTPEISTVKFAAQGVNVGTLEFSGEFEHAPGRPPAEGEFNVTAQNGKIGDLSINGSTTVDGGGGTD